MSSPTTRPLLSASLIVKDEEDMLPRCLAALADVVDEIVVLDTGSTDRTVEIAEAAGAIVHRGQWHDDFARSRNESLSHCTGRWVIIVDADEEVRVGDIAAFRKALARSTVDAFTVRVDNVEDHGGSITFTHDPIRLFRRTRFEYEGRIHEHVVARTARTVKVSAASQDISIMHFGYLPAVVASKDKVQRNVQLAQAAWAADPENVLARIELVRSLSSTDRHGDTMEHLRILRNHGAEARRTALHLGVKVLMQMGALDEAVEWAEEIRHHATPTVNSTKLHGEVLFRLGRYEEALEVVQLAPEEIHDLGVHGTHDSGHAVTILRGRLLHILGREAEAAEALLSVAAPGPDSLWPLLIEILRRQGELARAVQPFFDGMALLGDARAKGVLAEMSKVPVELGEAFFEVLASRSGGLAYALAFVLSNAERLSIERAAAWSAVAREAGLVDSCALVRQMDAPALPALQRITAAATVLCTYGDERGHDAIQRSAGVLVVEEVTEALYIISELAPIALRDLIVGYVTSQRRALELADALVALGAQEEGIAVLHHGLEECAFDPESGVAISATLAHLELLL